MDTTSSKYRNKLSGEVFHAKQVIRIKEDGYVEFNDGKPELIPMDDKGVHINGMEGHQRIFLGDWLLTSAIGERAVCQPGRFHKEFGHHFES